MRWAIPAALFAAALGLAGCGRNESTTAVATPGGSTTVTTPADGGTVTVSGPDGQTARVATGSGAAISAQLPDFLPLYPGAKVTTSFAAPTPASNDTEGGSVAFQTTAPPSDVIAFYKQKAIAQGLRETISASTGDTMTYLASKEQMVVQVVASKRQGATDTVLSWQIPRGK